MDIELEKVDIVRERTKVNYEDAKEALLKANGNVLDAIIYIEKNQKSFADSVGDVGNEFAEAIKNIIKKGNVTRIKIKKDGKVILNIPVGAGIVGGAIGIYYMPAVVAIGALAAVFTKIEVEIERPDGKVEVVKDIMKNAGKEKTSKEHNDEA
ncbi:MAG: DUF4342 domain-containing protein [Clostridiales bacterium]|nr:DUF4342 domain-containing protein [Clostridiales bacterium]